MFQTPQPKEALASGEPARFFDAAGLMTLFPGRIQVKLLSNFATSAQLCRIWTKLCKAGNTWNSIEITDVDEADYFCVINYPLDGHFYRPERTIVLKMEEKESSRPFFPKEWVDMDRRKYFFVFDERNSLEWHLGKTYTTLSNSSFTKTKVLSTVTSSAHRLEGHKRRIALLQYLEQHDVPFDLYGRDNLFQFQNYAGALPRYEKDAGILPYKYTIAVENVCAKTYFTEKIVDAILGECLCFYWGCPDLETYIHPDAFIRLDLDNFAKSRTIIEETIRQNEWERRLPVIRGEKTKILNELQIMPVIERIILRTR